MLIPGAADLSLMSFNGDVHQLQARSLGMTLGRLGDVRPLAARSSLSCSSTRWAASGWHQGPSLHSGNQWRRLQRGLQQHGKAQCGAMRRQGGKHHTSWGLYSAQPIGSPGSKFSTGLTSVERNRTRADDHDKGFKILVKVME